MNKKRFVYAVAVLAILPILLELILRWRTYFPDLSVFKMGSTYDWGLFFSMIIEHVVLALLFVFLFVRTYKSWGHGIVPGLKFGVILGLLFTLPNFVSSIIWADPSLGNFSRAEMFWFNSRNFLIYLVPTVLRGILVGFVYKE